MRRLLQTLQIGLGWDPLNVGGADRVFAELALNLSSEGIEFTGIVPGPRDLVLRSGGRMHPTAASQAGTLARVLGARRILGSLTRSRSVDLIATHFALYASGAMSDIRRYPHVVHFHGPWAAESAEEGRHPSVAFLMHRLERFVYDSADRVIVLSRAFAQVAIQNYHVPEEKIRIVPGSADTQRFAIPESRDEARGLLGWSRDRRILLAVRRLSARMGLDKLIAAMVPVSRKYPEVLLYLAGKGHMLSSLRRQVEELGLNGNVEFLGYVPDDRLAFAYCAAELNLVPTVAWEGFGLVAVEALAAGTPSMVTPTGGLPEVVCELSSDLIFASCSSEDIAQGLMEALSGSRRLPSREACREYAGRRFASTRMARDMASIYRELCPQPQPEPAVPRR
jgi:glycosyltransferase involved in cell wall biosynthesis